MADTRQRTTWGNRFRFLARALGLTGLLLTVFAVIVLGAEFRDGFWSLFSLNQLNAVWQGAHGDSAKQAALVAAIGGGVAVLIGLFELVTVVFFGGGNRTAAGTLATVGVVSAVVSLVSINLYSFSHFERYDVTRDKRFTLPPELADELSKLRPNAPTTIVVLQKHKMFGTLTDKRDSYTKAAEEKVTEKVLDLVDQFRAFGPQFKVHVLDTEAFGYDKQLDALTQDAPELKTAIEAAPENSIFFHANKHVQRLAFNEFLQLDRTASKAEDSERANLVLLPQGIDRFARRVLAVQERRPKVAVCVIHEVLTTTADHPKNPYTLAGMRKALTAQGFDVVDIVLKKNWFDNSKELEPAANSFAESKLERLEIEEEDARAVYLLAQSDVRTLAEFRKRAEDIKKRPLVDRVKFYNEVGEHAVDREWTEMLTAFRRWAVSRRPLTEENENEFRTLFLAGLATQATRADDEVKDAEKELQEAEAKVKAAYRDERLLQDRRMSDVSAKLTKQLADVDLLIIPRVTVEDAMQGPGVRAELHKLAKEQVKAAKGFMKRGKPVLACLGPITTQVAPRANESPEAFDKRLMSEITAADGFERLLADRGVHLGRTVVLFDGETKSAARANLFDARPFEVPAATLPDAPSGGAQKANPIASAVRLTGRTADQALDLKLKAVRPITLSPGWQAKQPFSAEFVFTAPGSWNELRPFPLRTRRPDGTERVLYTPKFIPLATDDPKKGTPDEERRGPFSVAVAIENKIPAVWVNEESESYQAATAVLTALDRTSAAALATADDKQERTTQRTVVFGSGYIFVGDKLEPAQEKLLLHTVNWLTAREDRLPKGTTPESPAWQYPRVAMSDERRALWQLGAVIGLPLTVAFLGVLVMMFRRMR